MAVQSRFITAYVSGSDIADYYLRPTEDRLTRDLDREALRLPDAHEFAEIDATIPLINMDASRTMQRLMAVSRETPSREQIANFAVGRNFDGDNVRRQRIEHKKTNGITYSPKHLVDVVIRADVSFGLALSRSETRANRALILSPFHDAADDTMREFQARFGITRKMTNRVKHEVEGELFWVSFTHHASRPNADGTIYPHLHRHHLVSNNVLTPNGNFMAIHMKKMMGEEGSMDDYFQSRLLTYASHNGIACHMDKKYGVAVIDDIPNHVRKEFFGRHNEILAQTREYAKSVGVDYDSLPLRQQKAMRAGVNAYSKRLQSHDGLVDGATRASWQGTAMRMGWTPADVARPSLAPSWRDSGPSLTTLERLRTLRREVNRTWHAFSQRLEKSNPYTNAFSVKLWAGMAGLTQALMRTNERISQLLDLKARTKQIPRLIERAKNNIIDKFASIRFHEPIRTLSREVEILSMKMNMIAAPGFHPDEKQAPSLTRSIKDARAKNPGMEFKDILQSVRNHEANLDFYRDRLHPPISKPDEIPWKNRSGENVWISKDTSVNMLNVYGRKVLDGEMKMSEATAKFLIAEERNAHNVALQNGHSQEKIKDNLLSIPTSENRDNREKMWETALNNRMELIREAREKHISISDVIKSQRQTQNHTRDRGR